MATKIICAAVECKNNIDGKCKLDRVHMGEWYVHTVYNGVMHLWECKQYEEMEDEFYKNAKEYIQRKLNGARDDEMTGKGVR